MGNESSEQVDHDVILEGHLGDRELLFAVTLHVVRHGKVTIEELTSLLELNGDTTVIEEAEEVIEAEERIKNGEEVPMDDPEVEELMATIDDIEAEG